MDNINFGTTPVSLAVGTLNPANTPQSVWDCVEPMSYSVMTTVITGSPASFTVVLEGTVDGTNWFTVATTTNTAGETVFGSSNRPFTNLRARCTAVSGGTAPTIDIHVLVSDTPLKSPGSGLAPSAAGAGSTAAAPTAGTSIVQVTVTQAGTYRVQYAGGFGATAESTQLDNIGVKVNASFKFAIPLANTANTMSQPYTAELVLAAGDTVAVYVINNASAGAIYKADLTLTQIS